jgi:hypothetical protein
MLNHDINFEEGVRMEFLPISGEVKDNLRYGQEFKGISLDGGDLAVIRRESI